MKNYAINKLFHYFHFHLFAELSHSCLQNENKFFAFIINVNGNCRGLMKISVYRNKKKSTIDFQTIKPFKINKSVEASFPTEWID